MSLMYNNLHINNKFTYIPTYVFTLEWVIGFIVPRSKIKLIKKDLLVYFEILKITLFHNNLILPSFTI